MNSDADAKERARLVAAFAPRANQRPEIAGSAQEIDILISTDVLSEGQNLQDCGVLVNYDLHWNPTRLIQRAGRIDRIGSTFETLWIYNMFPDAGLERLLGLVASLSQKIAAIDRSGLLDASILGEVAHPQNFNTLLRIAEEDGRVIEEQEAFVELASSEFLLQHLKELLNQGGRADLEDLPDGIHSGLLRAGARGVFFAFVAERRRRSKEHGKQRERTHYWRYVELSAGMEQMQVEENRYLISSLIQAHPDTPRVVPPEGEIDIFTLQERAISSILQEASREHVSTQLPKILDPIQGTLRGLLEQGLGHPQFERAQVIAALQAVNVPQPRAHLKTMKGAYNSFLKSQDAHALVAAIATIGSAAQRSGTPEAEIEPLTRKDLRLVCFEYVGF